MQCSCVFLYFTLIKAQSSLTVKDLMGKVFHFEDQLVYTVQFSYLRADESSLDVNKQTQWVLIKLYS